MTQYPAHLLKLIELFKLFPGIGTKSAERLAFQLIHWPDERLQQLATALSETKKKITTCLVCGALIGEEGCRYCNDSRRDPTILCVTAFPKDLFLIDATGQYRGYYHVLGGLISPMYATDLTDKQVNSLKKRILQLGCQEVILALDSTVEGDATALYLKKQLSDFSIKTSRLAFGLPMGSSFDFIDGGTLSCALEGRSRF